jgi:hypothetical protein
LLSPAFAQPPKPAPPHPIDAPLRYLATARAALTKVDDYACTLIKQERMWGVLSPVNIVTMMVRNRPFSVYMHWSQPRAMAGQEACYVAGKNDGKMRAKSAGLLGGVGFVTIDPNDPRARKTSNHAITEAGLGNMMAKLAQRWQPERKLNRVTSKVAEYEYNKRRCVRVEIMYTRRVQDSPYYRSVVYFDKENHLPIRTEIYDWPQAGGKPGGEVIEVYSYVNLKLNPGLPDSVFEK